MSLGEASTDVDIGIYVQAKDISINRNLYSLEVQCLEHNLTSLIPRPPSKTPGVRREEG